MTTQQILLKILILAFGATGVVGLIGYWPTIKDLYRKKPSANILSYALWTFTTCIGFLYSIFVLNDLLLRIIYGLNFGACILVVFLSVGLKNGR
jgi:hypothetical protein